MLSCYHWRVKNVQWDGPYLWVGELQARDGEHHLSCSDEEVLRDQPGHVDAVGSNVLHLFDALALED